MFTGNNNVPFTMPVQPANNYGGGFGDGAYGGWFWIIILIVLLFGDWGNGYGFGGFGGNGSTVAEGYVLTNDFSNLSRQISEGFGATESKLDSISNGICSLGYDQLAQMNGINQNIANTGNVLQNAITQQSIADMGNMNALTAQMTGLGTQLADCCCQSRYETATKFADLNYNIATQDCQIRQNISDVGRNLADVGNENTRAILAAIQSIKDDAKDEKIATLQTQLSEARLLQNNNAQTCAFNEAIDRAVRELTPKPPVAAFQVPAPWQYNGCGCNTCGC